ncbi:MULTISPECIES: signal recognition particle-docking protein FtsY [Aeromonas]|uniref:signal recognition particle-docking protein FtsY n=1 Tax=Aeromonas caviae TaxID=648 RepID=UPI001378DE71|nr:signal recognition particle-docking protein FtsY [Aeromonas caviae]MDX7680725.1 signal recognition particle-docking protein FtsY [Aeromonas caviae]MDX7749486.1 signal recognition particle-docking protein FtsY [Aeromonas caviae]MDX7810890.1 signal recognition particle-docking protein FtsY [Aeromonas caviae]MDX7867479.1 signal recognition particle-docking protein FtsY [Aeromonas caviae]MDX7889215.1 signal recognition particle-docking protein FtsY [Aeromonas caviae]
MAKGLFSWLGFGRKKEEAEAVPSQAPDATPAVVESEAAAVPAPVADVAPADAPAAKPEAPLSGPDEGPLVVEEPEGELEPVIVNEALISTEAQVADDAIFAAKTRAAEEARIAAEARAAEEARVAAEARVAEEARIAAEARVAEEARIAAEARAAEEARIAAEARAAEEARIAAEARAAEEARIAAEARAAEEARVAAEAQAEEEARVAAEAQAAEEARVAKEAQRAEDLRLVAAMEAEAAALAALPLAAKVDDDTQEKPQREGFFARLKRSLVRTRENIGSGFFGLFSGKKIDDDLFEELETQLLTADLGVDTTTRIIEGLVQHADRKQLKDAEALYGLLKQDMGEMLAKVEQPLVIDTSKKPYVILMVGVNGVGKTTTIGKLAKQFQAEGKSVMLAAGDTFRAAAVEQLQVWGQRNNIPVIAQHTGADSASVIYDAIEAARSRGADVLIADTAGRLQNKSNLMEELKKVVRVMKKLDDAAPHEIMLTLDAGTGQNALSQAKLFSEAVGLTGITLTKLDGTAKGGVIFAVADKFQIPIRYIGVGEGIDDLRPFVANDFIEALFSREE